MSSVSLRLVLYVSLPGGKFVSPDPSPTKAVAAKAPDEELKARLLPVFGAKLPVAAVTNKGKVVVSVDSSETATLVALVALAAEPETLIPHVPDAPVPSALGAPIEL